MRDDEFNVVQDISKKNKEKRGNIWGILLLIWFFVSIILMIYFSEKNTHYAIMVFGQYFFVFGIIFLSAGKGTGKLIALLLISIGLGAIIIPYMQMHPELIEGEIVWDSVIVMLMVLLFAVVGFFMVILPIKKKKELKQKCTETVLANVKFNKDYTEDGSAVYCPVYTFEYYNEKYIVTNNYYTNVINLRKEGTDVEIKINPNDPNEFLDNSNGGGAAMISVGIIFLSFSLPILIFILENYQFIK